MTTIQSVATGIVRSKLEIQTANASGVLETGLRVDEEQRTLPQKASSSKVVAVVSGATLSTNALLGNQFSSTLTADCVLSNPTNALDGQLLLWIIKQDGTGNRLLTFGNKFRFGDEIGTPVIASGANKTSYILARYNGADDFFDVISFVSNY